MHHDDIYPNKSYRDALDIENGTDNELIYKGIATGVDINGDGVNLENAISLGLFKPNDKKTLVEKQNYQKNMKIKIILLNLI